MVSKRKFKRDYIILEAKDMNFRSKERVLPKAFAKIEVNDEKSIVALYVENLKNLKDGYDVIALRTDYERLNLGRINLNSQGKGEFVLDLGEDDSDIKAIALTYDKYVPLIGFKGNKIENYEELIFEPEEEIEEYTESDEEEYIDRNDVYEEVEYVNPDEGEYEYEEVEYIYEDDLDNEDIFFKTVKASFGQRRKTLLNSLGGLGFLSKDQIKEALKAANIDEKRRGETLSIDEFANLSNEINKFSSK